MNTLSLGPDFIHKKKKIAKLDKKRSQKLKSPRYDL